MHSNIIKSKITSANIQTFRMSNDIPNSNQLQIEAIRFFLFELFE
jgi:hypothetical protein